MSNLITSLAVAGCRKSDGTPNASGYVFLYAPGTTTIVPGYKDDALTEQWTTVGGGIPLDAAGRANIWVGGKVDVLITDASGATVNSLLGFNGTTASSVEVENAGYTGAIVDPVTEAVSQGAGGLTDLDTVLSRLAASVGGTDGQYKESKGATPRLIADVLRETHVSVKDFGALGNGKNDDTSACQQAITEAVKLGGGVVYFPPGIYKTSSALLVPSTTGVRLLGAGRSCAQIQCTNGAQDGVQFSGATECSLGGLTITHTGTSTGSALKLTGVTDFYAYESILCDNVQFAFGLTTSGDCSLVRVDSSTVTGSTSAAVVSGVNGAWLDKALLAAGSGYCVDITGATSNVFISKCGANATNGIRFNTSGVDEQEIVIVDSPDFGQRTTTPLTLTALGTAPYIVQRGNSIPTTATSSAVGATQTPVVVLSDGIKLTAASGGAGTVTVAAPAIVPANVDDGRVYTFTFVNASGGAVTWSLNAIYKFNAIPTTDGHTIGVMCRWDGAAFREIGRADTVT